MRPRVLHVLALCAATAAILIPLRLGGRSVSGQDAALTTPWGDPSFEGIWTRDAETPLQRPTKYADREFFTDEERAALDKQRAEIIDRDASATRRERGSEQDVGGAYNATVFTSHLPLAKRTSLIVDPPNGKLPAVTADEQKRRSALREYFLALLQPTAVCKNGEPFCAGGKYGPPSPRRFEPSPVYLTGGGQGTPTASGGVVNRAFGPEDRGHGERCLGGTIPDLGGYRRIVQSRTQISIGYDVGQGQGFHRTIPVTDAPHVPDNVRLWWGDSRARWEGKTLVVDVRNFSPKSSFQGSHEHLHVVERWTRLDADTMEYEARIEDPTVWTKPWTVKQQLKRQSDEANRIYPEPRCHEGNYGMAALLSGARAEERAFAEGRGPDPATLCNGACGGFAGGFADDGEDANPLR